MKVTEEVLPPSALQNVSRSGADDAFVLVQLSFSSILVLLQLSLMPVFVIYADLRRRILYRIMLSIALSDFLQLYAIWQFTLFEALGYVNWPLGIEKFSSGVYIVAWDHLIINHFLLALNRFIIILRAYYSPTAHKHGESGLEIWLFNFLLVASWLLLFGLTILFMTPVCAGIWNRHVVGFFYDMTLSCSVIYGEWEFYLTIVFPAISLCFYTGIVCILKKTRNIVAVSNHHNSKPDPQQAAATQLSVQEKRILWLSVLLFVMITAMIWAWYFDYKHPPWTMLFCTYLLVNSSMTLAMNSEFRQRYFHMMGRLCAPLRCCAFHLPMVSSLTEVIIRRAGAAGGAAGGKIQTAQNTVRSNNNNQQQNTTRGNGASNTQLQQQSSNNNNNGSRALFIRRVEV